MEWINKNRDNGTIEEVYMYPNRFGAVLIRNEFQPQKNTFQRATFTGGTLDLQYCLYGETEENLTDPEITEKLKEIEETYPQA